MLQKHLKATHLTAAGATFARYVFSAPLIVMLVLVYLAASGQSLPDVSRRFFVFGAFGSVVQILATVCVVALFAERNFAVGITFKKTEVVLTAIVGYLVLGEGITRLGAVAILLGLAGVILLSDPPGNTRASGLKRVVNRASLLGLGAGLLFAFSAVAYRGALTSLSGGTVFLHASFTLACVTTFQSLLMAVWLHWQQPGEMQRVFRNWRVSGLVGVASMIGSLGWFTAFSLQTAAYVKALGQIELVFSYLATHFVFHEKSSRRELLAMGLIILSILLLVLAL